METKALDRVQKSLHLGSNKQLGAFISILLPWIVTYRFPAIHGFHPEPPVFFRQCLHGDNPWPVEKGGHRHEPSVTGGEILMNVKLQEIPKQQSKRLLGLTNEERHTGSFQSHLSASESKVISWIPLNKPVSLRELGKTTADITLLLTVKGHKWLKWFL